MKINFEQIYQHIGTLFYAIASERGKLNAITYDTLRRLVEHEWSVTPELDSLEVHMIDCLRSATRNAFDEALTAETAFGQFTAYFSLHSIPFGKPLRAKILATAKTIAAQFSGSEKPSGFVDTLENLLHVDPIRLMEGTLHHR